MADHACADHVGNKPVARAVPYKEHRAGAATAVDLIDLLCGVGGDLSFILHDSCRPKRAHNVYRALFSQANQQAGCALAQVSKPANLSFLPKSAGEHLHLGSDRALVVIEAGEGDAKKIVAIAAIIAQQEWRTIGLGNQ